MLGGLAKLDEARATEGGGADVVDRLEEVERMRPGQMVDDAEAWQVLQDLINVLPVSAKIPSEVDVELQRKVASFFQNVNMVDAQLPRFLTAARSMREGWLET